MTAPALELQKLIIDALKANAILSGMVSGRIYDSAPDGTKLPYVKYGPTLQRPFNAEGITANEHDVQIDCYSERRGSVEISALTWQIKQTLEAIELDVAQHGLARLTIGVIRHLDEPDGVTKHGIVSLTALIEEFST